MDTLPQELLSTILLFSTPFEFVAQWVCKRWAIVWSGIVRDARARMVRGAPFERLLPTSPSFCEWASSIHCGMVTHVTLHSVICNGDLETLLWFHAHYNSSDLSRFFLALCDRSDKSIEANDVITLHGGDFERWCLPPDRSPLNVNDLSPCAVPAARGDLHMIKVLVTMGSPLRADACFAAAVGGHLSTLRYLREHLDCPWNAMVLLGARWAGSIDIERYYRCHSDVEYNAIFRRPRETGTSSEPRFGTHGFPLKYGGELCLPPIHGESIWDAILSKRDAWKSRRKDSKLRRLIYDGVPPSRRADIWKFLLWRNSHPLDCSTPPLSEDDDSRQSQIEKDVSRTLRGHRNFSHIYNHKRDELKSILLQCTRIHPTLGYCAGMASWAAILLSVGCTEEDALWCFHQIMHQMDFFSLFGPGLTRVLSLLDHLEKLLRTHMCKLSHHLFDCLDLSPSMIATHWCILLFFDGVGSSLCSPHVSYLIWDLCMLDGHSIAFLTSALTCLKLAKELLLGITSMHRVLHILLGREHRMNQAAGPNSKDKYLWSRPCNCPLEFVKTYRKFLPKVVKYLRRSKEKTG